MMRSTRPVPQQDSGVPGNSFPDMLTAVLPRMRAYALAMTRDRSAAEDLLQETALKALRYQAQFTMGTNFTAWMYCILRHEFVNSLRRDKRRPALLGEVPEEFLARSGNQEEKTLTREVVAAMDKLPPQQREVLVLICAGGMRYEEAAVAVRASIGTVKSRLWRARRQMRRLLLGDATGGENEGENEDIEMVPRVKIHRTKDVAGGET